MKYLKVFTDFLEVAEGLSDAGTGRLFRAMLRYAQDGAVPAFRGKEAVAWTVAKQHIDREVAAYKTKVEADRRNGRKGAAIRWSKVAKDGDPYPDHSQDSQDNDNEKEKNNDNDKDNDSLSSTEPRLTAEEREKKPSLEEVMSFSQEAGLNVDVQYFYNYYEANGWYIGKRPIRDWKAALKAWARKTPLPRPVPAGKKNTRETFLELMERARIEEAKQI